MNTTDENIDQILSETSGQDSWEPESSDFDSDFDENLPL